MVYNEPIKHYLVGIVDVIQNIDIEQISKFFETLQEAKAEGRSVFVFGNGGSASTASHMVADFNKGLSYGKKRRFKLVCLNDNIPIMLAYANDISYEDIFVEQLKNFLTPEDIVIGISGSGNSENVIRAIDYANAMGALTIGICGFKGGALKEKAKQNVHVASDDMQKSEDIFMMLTHIAYQVLDHDD